ncbi:peptidoglycan DD-metalloendopeptidase family protein [Deinococcus sp.]|uniref:peptidoglycan DD-metalloendopeptidase family protein n=1 Tax=Deinococcus sp. TaxID=47478 RepID=UPI003B59A833
MKVLTFSLAFLLSALGVAGAYTVQKGDTLYNLARANNLTVEELRRLNNLPSDTIEIGQILRFSESEPLPPPIIKPAPSPAVPAEPPKAEVPSGPASPTPPKAPTKAAPKPKTAPIVVRSGSNFTVGGVQVILPEELGMGDAFSVRLSGIDASSAQVRFPSEIGEDVRMPNEMLTPFGAAGVYLVPGRVVLGKTTPVIVEIKVGTEVVRAVIPLRAVGKSAVVPLQLSKGVAAKLTDPGKAAEDALVNTAYERRGLPLWTKPFAAPLSSTAFAGSFGQSRTYVKGGPVDYHYGADYPAKLGTPIKAVNDGTVVIAGMYPVRGGLVMIDHGGGVSSLYFHQSKVRVKPGQKITRGEVIGEVGTTGISEGPHLHLEIRVRGEATDPADWFNRLWP